MTIQSIPSKLAEQLYNAYTSKQTINKEKIPANLSKFDAYDIQHQITDRKVSNNDDLAGYKISLTSTETQQLFHSDTPLYGALTHSCLSDGSIDFKKMNEPLLEIELMFVANEDITVEDDYAAILQKGMIAPGIEIPDSRFHDWFPKLSVGQVIADSAVAGYITLGEAVSGLTYEKLGNVRAELKLNGEVIANGNSKEVLGNPVHAIQWLTSELARNGRIIEKDMIISTGTFIPPKKLESGLYAAAFTGIGEVQLTVI